MSKCLLQSVIWILKSMVLILFGCLEVYSTLICLLLGGLFFALINVPFVCNQVS